MHSPTIVICGLGAGSNPWLLPASMPVDEPIGGGERTLHEVAAALASRGHLVELRGHVSRSVLDQLARHGGGMPSIDLQPRRPTAHDLVIVPEGWPSAEWYAPVALSPARCILLLLGPSGIVGWPFVAGWQLTDPLTLDPALLSRPEHYRAMAAMGFELWTNSEETARRAEAAGVLCTWIGLGQPIPPPAPAERSHDLTLVAANRWAPLARRVVEQVSASCREIPRTGRDDLVIQLARARILVLPARVEGTARIQVEARMVGTVPVCLPNPYAAGLDEEHGTVVVDTLAQMPDTITDLLANPDRLAELSARGRAAAAEQCRWDRFVERLEAACAAPGIADAARDARAAFGDVVDRHLSGLADARVALERSREHAADLERQVADVRVALERSREHAGNLERRLATITSSAGYQLLEWARRLRARDSKTNDAPRMK